MKLFARIKLAWRQARAGLRGYDIRAAADLEYVSMRRSLQCWLEKAATKKVVVRTFEFVDRGIDYRGELVAYSAEARYFTVPEGFLAEDKQKALKCQFFFDRHLLHIEQDRGERMLVHYAERAAADLGRRIMQESGLATAAARRMG